MAARTSSISKLEGKIDTLIYRVETLEEKIDDYIDLDKRLTRVEDRQDRQSTEIKELFKNRNWVVGLILMAVIGALVSLVVRVPDFLP